MVDNTNATIPWFPFHLYWATSKVFARSSRFRKFPYQTFQRYCISNWNRRVCRKSPCQHCSRRGKYHTLFVFELPRPVEGHNLASTYQSGCLGTMLEFGLLLSFVEHCFGNLGVVEYPFGNWMVWIICIAAGGSQNTHFLL